MNLFGIGVTIFYVLLIFCFRWGDFHTLKEMSLNEFGDFFAGVFGPLTLFWLILGYIQQQKELQQNTSALNLQAQELKNAVEQHKELVETTRQQLELEHIKFKQAVEPNLILISAIWISKGLDRVNYRFVIKNSGKLASNIAFTTNPLVEEIFSHPTLPFLGEGETYVLEWNTKSPPEFLDFTIHFKDSNRTEYEKHFQLKLDIEQGYNIN